MCYKKYHAAYVTADFGKFLHSDNVLREIL